MKQRNIKELLVFETHVTKKDLRHEHLAMINKLTSLRWKEFYKQKKQINSYIDLIILIEKLL